MKKSILLIVIILSQTSIYAQGCLPEGIEFTEQEQIDNFQANYPGCTEIEGDVIIGNPEYSGIANLDGLNVITSVGSLSISQNYYLSSLEGLNNLTTIENYFEISQNNSLTSLSGLEGLDSVFGNIFIDYSWLTDLTGLEGLNYIGGGLYIGSVYYGGNTLFSLTGLEGLNSIGDNLLIGNTSALTSLTGLEGLTSIGGSIMIVNCGQLINIQGLENIQSGSITDLRISNNPALTECNVQSICDYLVAPNGIVEIYNNFSGCNNASEIANSCGFQVPCLPYGNYYFTSQNDIDNFQANYPGCAEIAGAVIIYENISGNITNLSGLSVLTSIGGNFKIYGNVALTSLSGLEGVDSIGGNLIIDDNDALTSLAGLEGSTFIGGSLFIDNNGGLTSLSGLEGLTSIGGDFRIYNNDALTSLTGLYGLTSLGGNFEIRGNDALINLPGLELLISISTDLVIRDNNALNNLTGLEGLTSIGGNFRIYANTALTNLTGLEGLTSIGGYLKLEYNNSLTSLTELMGLTSIGSYIYINNNDGLTSLSGLDNIQANSITDLYIHYNSNLADCDVYSICQYIAAPNGTIVFYNNAPGCNNLGEVQQACLTGIENTETTSNIAIIPNPSKDKITISSPAITGNTQLTIFAVKGEKVLERQLTDNETQIDISALPRGVYFVRLQGEKMVEVTKLVKE
jgi:UDP-3-O-[3-hydroxymyristoyl] glucosamine N-acyltransferase